MPISPNASQPAQAQQSRAAQDSAPQVRLIAGPGTGKSTCIEQRVCWLSGQGISGKRIAVVSFTRASAADLKFRIVQAGERLAIQDITDVRVSTLHSLALKILRKGGLLTQYPADPLVLDDWELKFIFDAEFSRHSGFAPSRCEKIRYFNEAYWSTGTYQPANYIPPNPPIAGPEQLSFQTFHNNRTQLYSCVLPGEIIRQCVEAANAGILDPAALARLDHLIVDEYQDLNPLDQEFVARFIGSGVITFIAGDDDQSIYSFRFADPTGIQNFSNIYPNSANHNIILCFRCTPNILAGD